VACRVDFCLSLIEEDYSDEIAFKLARELVIHFKRSGEQDQYSEALQFQVQSCDRFANLSAWILCNLKQDLSVEMLAQKACMSARNFARVFKAVFGKAPADFVASARIAEARQRLRVPRNSIESVAFSVGFRSARTFCRAFARYVGCQPSGAELRQRLFIFRALLRTRLSSRQSPWLKASLLCPNGKTHSALYRRKTIAADGHGDLQARHTQESAVICPLPH